jgi:hypothetical protein
MTRPRTESPQAAAKRPLVLSPREISSLRAAASAEQTRRRLASEANAELLRLSGTRAQLSQLSQRAFANISTVDYRFVGSVSTAALNMQLVHIMARASGDAHAVLITWPSEQLVTIEGDYGPQIKVADLNGRTRMLYKDVLVRWPEIVSRILLMSSYDMQLYARSFIPTNPTVNDSTPATPDPAVAQAPPPKPLPEPQPVDSLKPRRRFITRLA